MNGEYVTFRKEIKYILPLHKALAVEQMLDSLLQKDSYSKGGSYAVRSLYFDSVNNMDFAEKTAGTQIRKKIRLRIYNGESSVCKLELKQKNDDCQCKESVLITQTDAEAIRYGSFGVLKSYFGSFRAAERIYSIMEMGRYRPVVLVEYDRTAYQYPMYDTRITLDRKIRSTESNLDLFSQNPNYLPIEYENVIFEIKYSGRLMGFISDALAQFGLTQNTYSKYCMGRRIYYDFNY